MKKLVLAAMLAVISLNASAISYKSITIDFVGIDDESLGNVRNLVGDKLKAGKMFHYEELGSRGFEGKVTICVEMKTEREMKVSLRQLAEILGPSITLHNELCQDLRKNAR